MTGRVLRFPYPVSASEEVLVNAERFLAMAPARRLSMSKEFRLDEPETLLGLCDRIRRNLEQSPAEVRSDAEWLYQYVTKPGRRIGILDEKHYFAGELALIAGTACRILARRDEARRWFDRAEAAFRNTVDAISSWSRLTYQRLALRTEEREFDEVLELLPSLILSFENLGMAEDGLKCRFLEGIAFMESERLDESIDAFEDLVRRARALKSENLLATASYNLVQLFAMKGDADRAIPQAKETIPLLRRLRNRVGLAKIQWGLGRLFQTQGNLRGAIDTYRVAQEEFREIGMRADIAALHLVIADLLLELNEDGDAFREILSALPIIEEEKMVPEGVAALALLRESVRQQHINREALRDLHGYFEEIQK